MQDTQQSLYQADSSDCSTEISGESYQMCKPTNKRIRSKAMDQMFEYEISKKNFKQICKLIKINRFINPIPLVILPNNFVLYTNMFLDDNDDKIYDFDQESMLNHFQKVDYTLYSNKYRYINMYTTSVDQGHYQWNSQYLVHRYKSFGSQRFKQLADTIDIYYNQIEEKQRWDAQKKLEYKIKLTQKTISFKQQWDIIEDIFKKYPGQGVKILTFTFDSIYKHFQGYHINEVFLNQRGYDFEEFHSTINKNQEIPLFGDGFSYQRLLEDFQRQIQFDHVFISIEDLVFNSGITEEVHIAKNGNKLRVFQDLCLMKIGHIAFVVYVTQKIVNLSEK